MDYDELVQRLRSAKAWLYLENTQEWSDSYNDYSDAPTEAADALVKLQARVAELTAERDNWCAFAGASNEDAQRAEADLAAARALLPGVYYMDPPDGGQVEMLEQLRRMADDAARYRWLRSRFRVFGPHIDGQHAWCATGDIGRLRGPSIDAAIDAALAGKDAPK
jgi:hypothetical protein